MPKWLVWTSQAFVGLLFLFSATVKGVDILGTTLKINEYMTSFGLPIAEGWAKVLAYLLVDFEFFLGLTLFSGVWRRVTSSLPVLFMLPLTLLTLYVAIANPVKDCGCFGDAITISNSATFWKNIFLLILSVIVFSSPGKMYRLLPSRLSGVVLLIGLLMSYFGFLGMRSVPIIDFRPFKVGSDLTELTRGGDGGEYDFRFIYEKEGREKAFTLDELADVDSTWTFVRDETVELTPPADPRGADFVLLDREGRPVTEEYTRQGSNAFLFFNTDLSRLREEEVKDVVGAIHGIGEKVTLVMSDSFEAIEGGDYGDVTVPFDEILYLDKSTSLTVVRSNPSAMVVIGDGKIARKATIKGFLRYAKEMTFASDPYRLDTGVHQARTLYFCVLGIGFLLLLGLGFYYRRRGFQ